MAEITIRISDRTLKIVGISVGGIALVCIFYYLWSSGVLAPKYRLHGYIAEASGLSVHAPVMIDGIQVGSVIAINLAGESASSDQKIEIVLRVNKRYQDAIRSDSTATLLPQGLLGGRYIAIQRGFTGNVISPGGEIRFARESTSKDFGNSVDKMIGCLKLLTNPAEEAFKAQH